VLVFVTVTAFLIVLANLLADLVSQLIDPRLRPGARATLEGSR
jgi:ABC-type dipeptide/oligopeptide/nickel transport system permease component